MAEGARDEDRIFPQLRPVNHFFDPIHSGKGLRIPISCAAEGASAADWALDPAAYYGNYYSLPQVKAVYLQAVLGPNPGTRDIYLRDFFVGMGHLVHLIQDMAQPEHTRNDQHLTGSQKILFNGTEASIWEQWGKSNLSDLRTTLVNFDGYPTVNLPDYRDYFHTDDKIGDHPAGKGLADFSNLNFVTQDTNYDDEDRSWACPPIQERPLPKCDYFFEPKIEEAARRTEYAQPYTVTDALGAQITATIDEEVYTSFVHDHYFGPTDTDIAHTYLSSIDHETARYGCKDLYSLTDLSYQTRANFLVPRAVGYSAGLVKHFFRGNIGATWTDVPGASGMYDLTIKNLSAEPIGDAAVTALYRAQPAYFNRSNSDDTMVIMADQSLAEFDPSFGVLSPGGSFTLHNVAIPGLYRSDSLLSFERRVVVTGTLGRESDALIALVQPPSGAIFKLDSSVDLVKMHVTCIGPVSGFRNVPADYASRPPVHEIAVTIAPDEQCRALLSHMQLAQPSFEGEAVAFTYRVTRDALVVEDLSAVINASDLAVGGCHSATHSGHCDRFISRTGSCTGAKPPYQCIATSLPWGDYSGPYAIKGGDPNQ
jgi:hypothetical protein